MPTLIEKSGPQAVIGTSWGDEGKGGKIDFLAKNARIVARYQGGDNAGHSVTVGELELKLHLVPSGIVNPSAISVIGSEVVVNPLALHEEIKTIQQKGIDVDASRLLVDRHAQLIMPWHRMRDNLQEAMRGGGKIGTTGRGIGPAYSDRSARTGLKVNALLAYNFEELFVRELAFQEQLIRMMANTPAVQRAIEEMQGDPKQQEKFELFLRAARGEAFDKNRLLDQLNEARDVIIPLVADVVPMVRQAVSERQKVLFEGAQGVLLDLNHGTEQYVTSSHPGADGIAVAFGIYPHQLDEVIGVMKAFQTRVGEGPMPTEVFEAEAVRLRGDGTKPWDEFGTTTGRPRRVGWLDVPLVKYGASYGGATCLAITKMDILAGLDQVPICVGYECNGAFYSEPPVMDERFLLRAKPVFDYMQGWEMPKDGVHGPEDVPEYAMKYIRKIEGLTGLPVKLASFGADRSNNILF
jgi:adenylosuccinate synthase